MSHDSETRCLWDDRPEIDPPEPMLCQCGRPGVVFWGIPAVKAQCGHCYGTTQAHMNASWLP